ncbi:MAG: hypothetical protein DYG98_24020 [Haliscomenobacteraceae bacterium CHB4]|nr:hypothetical protein [Haliscomenobacteraceae bacterium CHB4]
MEFKVSQANQRLKTTNPAAYATQSHFPQITAEKYRRFSQIKIKICVNLRKFFCGNLREMTLRQSVGNTP